MENRQSYICEDCDCVFLADKGNPPQRVFISYGHDEYKDFAYQLADALRDAGYGIFIDNVGIVCGEQWEMNLENGLIWTTHGGGNGLFLLLMTPYSVRRPDGYCLNEIAYALDIHLKIIPIMLKRVVPPLSIYRFQYLDIAVDPKEVKDKTIARINKIIRVLENKESLDTTGNFKALETALKPLDFSSELTLYSKDFVGREWLLQQIEEKLNSSNKILLITGMPGIGKTAMSTYLYQKMPNVIGYYMFRRDDNSKLIFKTFVTTIAFQISSQIPEYQEILLTMDLEQISERFEGHTLFKKLISEPLLKLETVNKEKVLLIDGLDEAERDQKNVMAVTISMFVNDLPHWLKVVVFSRPVISVLGPLHFALQFEIDSNGKGNKEDMELYIDKRLKDYPAKVAQTIFDHSEGSFLYAKYACDNIIANDDYKLPNGMVNFYYDSFYRIFNSEIEYNNTRHILEWVLASSRPISQTFIMKGIGCDLYEMKAFRNRMKAFMSITKDNYIRIYHSSLAEWLIDEDLSGIYWVNVSDGKRALCSFIKKQLTEYLWTFKDLEDYKKKRTVLEEMLDLKVNENLFPMYLELLVSTKNWEEMLRFSIWYISSVPSTTDEVIENISVIQDKYIDNLSLLDANDKLYKAWETKLTWCIEISTTRQVICHDAYNYAERPVTETNPIYFLKLLCLPFLKDSFSKKSLEERCLVVKRAFSHMKYDFLRYYSLHEGSICSMFVDEIRENFYLILKSGKIENKEIIQWFEEIGKEC
jgi:hypothetical protein